MKMEELKTLCNETCLRNYYRGRSEWNGTGRHGPQKERKENWKEKRVPTTKCLLTSINVVVLHFLAVCQSTARPNSPDDHYTNELCVVRGLHWKYCHFIKYNFCALCVKKHHEVNFGRQWLTNTEKYRILFTSKKYCRCENNFCFIINNRQTSNKK
jgi:hypothetical protein